MKDQIIDFIRNFTAESPGNRVVDTNDRYYGEPLVRFATGGDQLFRDYKDIIGQFHLTPQEAFELKFGEGSFKDGTVISVVLPVSEAIRKGNRVKKDYASPEWALLRTFGDEVFINQLVDSTVSHIQQQGFRALSPSRSGSFKISNTETGPLPTGRSDILLM